MEDAAVRADEYALVHKVVFSDKSRETMNYAFPRTTHCRAGNNGSGTPVSATKTASSRTGNS